MNPKLIGLSGYGGVGKDTVADILVEHFGWAKFSFSDQLYKEVAEAFQVPTSLLYERSTKETPLHELALRNCYDQGFLRSLAESMVCEAAPGIVDLFTPRSPRVILQWWGTEYRRRQDPEYWLKCAESYMRTSSAHGLVNVSVRFDNEAQWVWRRGGINVKVVRRDVTPPNDYVSEKGVQEKYIDGTIYNNGAIEDLFPVVQQLRVAA